MKKRFFSMLLSLCLVLMLIPTMALAEEKIILTASYTTTVEQGGSVKPGETNFTLELMDRDGEPFEGVEPSGRTITTNGENDYKSELTFVGTLEDLIGLTAGVYVQQIDEGKDGWDYDDTVWGLIWRGGIVDMSMDDAMAGKLLIYPALYEEDGNGGMIYYMVDEKDPLTEMTFKNTYTKNEDDVTNLPKTGDSSNLAAWLVLLAVSVAGVTGAVVYSRRRKSAREK